MNIKKWKDFIAATLVETLVTIVLIGVGLVAVAGVFPYGLAHIRLMGDRAFVVQQAQSKMETLKGMTYTQLRELYVMKNDIVEPELYDVSGRCFSKYRLASDFTEEVFDEYGESVIHIKLEIYWYEDNPFGMLADRDTVENKSYILEGFKGEGAI